MRRGVTLIEALIFTALAIGLMIVGWGLMSRGSAITDASAHAMDIQVDVRALLENLTHDVGASHQVLDPGTTDRSRLVIVRWPTDGVTERLSGNTDPSFPFQSTSGTTTQRTPALRVTYAWNRTQHLVTRLEEKGTFVATSGPTPATLAQFAFEGATTVQSATLARNIQSLAFTCVGYDPVSGELRLTDTGGSPGWERTACVAVQLTASFEQGTYGKDRVAPTISVATKIWSVKRRSDEVYREYFSSTDEDLRW